jgi:arylsulfatase A-like enzyme
MKIFSSIIFLLFIFLNKSDAQEKKLPNVVYVIVDQWRAESTGYNGNTEVITPNIDRIAKQSINLKNAVSGMSVCTPYRAQLMSGMYPTTSGVFMNDVLLDTALTTIGKVYKTNGYDTGFIGKWHIDGHGRENFIPEERHQGFEYWKTLECTHDYNKSNYYEGNSPLKKTWDGYDALAQTKDAADYIKNRSKQAKPFLLFVSLGPPHDPFQSAPQKYKNLYLNKNISINPNVPQELRKKIETDLRGYYSHMSAIDDGIGEIWNAIEESGMKENTIFVFTADHGDLMGAHGQRNKQQPYSESIKIPFLISYPAAFGINPKTSSVLLNSPDIMPTLLKLSELPIPKGVEGKDLSQILLEKKKDKIDATLISCVQPFGQWDRKKGGKEYRGVFTKNYTYVKDLNGPWLLFDNEKDPYQMNNLVNNSTYKTIQSKLEKSLLKILKTNHDEFKPGLEYVKKWNYVVDETGTVPYVKINYEGKPIN